MNVGLECPHIDGVDADAEATLEGPGPAWDEWEGPACEWEVCVCVPANKRRS